MPAGQRKDRLAARAAAIFASLAGEGVPFGAGNVYARLKSERERAGLRMDENDLWIAATALALGAVLVSRDSDFRNIAGLVVRLDGLGRSMPNVNELKRLQSEVSRWQKT